MSLSAGEQQALDSIEGGLAGSDPALASLLATFARLASGDEMPVHEEIRVLRRRATRHWLRNWRPRRDNVRRDGRSLRLGWQQTIVLLWLAVTIAVVAVALVLSRGSGDGPCPEAWGAVACTRQAPAHSPRPAAHNTAAGQVLLTDAITWPTPTPAGQLMTDAPTQTGRDEARVSAAAPCPTLALASCSGRAWRNGTRSARAQILIRDGEAIHPASAAPPTPQLSQAARRVAAHRDRPRSCPEFRRCLTPGRGHAPTDHRHRARVAGDPHAQNQPNRQPATSNISRSRAGYRAVHEEPPMTPAARVNGVLAR